MLRSIPLDMSSQSKVTLIYRRHCNMQTMGSPCMASTK